MPIMQNMNISGLDLNLLRVLDALLTEQSVSKAARVLHSSQPSVSRALGQLRRWFGDPLFVRLRYGIAPTPRAEALRPALAAALAQLKDVLAVPEPFEPATSKRAFRLSTADYAQALLLPQLAQRLAERGPGVSVRVQPWSAGELVGALESGRVELALSPALERAPSVRTRALFSDSFVLITRRGHPLAKRPTLSAFAAARFVQIAPDGREGGLLDDALRARGLERHVVLRLPSFAVVPPLVSRSELVSVVPERLARSMQAAWPLEVARVPFALPGFTLSLLWHERAQHDAALAWLREQLISCCGEGPRGGAGARLRIEGRARGTL